MGNIRPPEFGVKKDQNTLTTQDPNAVLYVVTPDSKFIPAKADDEGRLELGAVTLDMSDIQIGAVEIKNHDTDDRVQVNTDNELLVESRLHDGAGADLTSTLVGSNQALDVNLVGFGSGGGLTEDDDDDIPDSLTRPTNIVLGYGYDTGNSRWERLNQTGGSLDVNITSPIPIEVNLSQVDDSVLVYGRTLTGTPTNLPLPLEVDDSVHPGGLATVLTSNLHYSFDSGSGTWRRTNQTAGNLHVDVQTSVLPTGAATEATQALLLTEATFTAEDFATQTTLATLLTEAAFQARINTLGQKLSAASTPVVLASDQSAIPVSQNGVWNINDITGTISLPTGAATELTLAAIDTTLDVDLSTRASEATLSAINTKTPALGQALMAASVPVAIASDQSNLNINLFDGAGTALTSTLVASDQALDVNIVAGAGGPEDTDDDSVAGSQQAVLNIGLNYGWDGIDWGRINQSSGRMIVDGSQVTQPISVASLPLPAGAATSVLQTAGNLSLSNIDTKLTDGSQITRLGGATGVGFISTRITTGAFSLDVSGLNFGFTGSAWETINSTSNRLNVDNLNVHTVDAGGDLYIAGTTEGSLSLGRVVDVDAQPTLTIGQISGLTLDVNGSLLTAKGDKNAVESPISASQNDQAFSAFISSFNLGTAGTETPIMLIRNPSPASTLTVYLNTLSVNNEVKTQTAKVKIYKSPTITVDGVAVVPANFKLGSLVTSVITPFSGPTVSANGTQLFIFATGANQNDLRRSFEFAVIIPPGEELLLTGEGSNNNTLVDLEVEWAEV